MSIKASRLVRYPNLAPVIGVVLLASLAAAVFPALSAADDAAVPLSKHGARAAGQFKHGDWPFKPPERPVVPATKNSGWVRNPIDAFILAKLEEKGLAPNQPADRQVLLRRVTFDLTGLPPTRQELQEFDADNSPDAYLKVVDRLLASPRYGERWAQHWLDVVRYAETDGFKQDAVRPNAYRYRDYVIKAFNDDLPYDRFIAQQLAGDELEPHNPDALVATGLNRLYPDEYNAANVKQRRQEILDEITDVTGLAFMGLTMGCAQCHDHKFDEILQTDYFRLQAFFTPMLPHDDLVIATDEERRSFTEKQAAWEEATRSIREEIDMILEPERQKLFDDAIQKFALDVQAFMRLKPEERTAQQKQWAYQAMRVVTPKLDEAPKKLKGEQKARYDELQKELANFDHLKPEPLPTALAIRDAGADAPATYRLATGNFRNPLEQVAPGFPEFLGLSEPQVPISLSERQSTGRRSALVAWLTRRDHPLTARVLVNRLWQHHFGVGIVPTANDFGVMGESPTHPELLDWLAVEFIERGWSMKAIHRLIVTSAAYQQSSFVDPDSPMQQRATKEDLGNQLLWHFRRRRLDGESIRDALLQVSGQLNTRMYGPSAKPELPQGLKSTYAWKADDKPEDRNRRSIYVFARRNLRLPLLEVFDLPDMHNSTARRTNTTTAQQALALLNAEFVLEQSRHWAGKLLQESDGNDERFVNAAYLDAYGRKPDLDELHAATDFLSKQATTASADGQKIEDRLLPIPVAESLDRARLVALVDFCHALLISNEFLHVD